jgi:hypothetical protein
MPRGDCMKVNSHPIRRDAAPAPAAAYFLTASLDTGIAFAVTRYRLAK